MPGASKMLAQKRRNATISWSLLMIWTLRFVHCFLSSSPNPLNPTSRKPLNPNAPKPETRNPASLKPLTLSSKRRTRLNRLLVHFVRTQKGEKKKKRRTQCSSPNPPGRSTGCQESWKPLGSPVLGGSWVAISGVISPLI